MKRCSTRKYDQQTFPEILEAIKSGKYTVKKPDGPRFKQTITWAKWRMIYDETDQILKNYYYCISCSAIYNVNITNSGKCLKTHAIECVPTENDDDRIDAHFSPIFNPNKKRKISIDHRNLVTQAAINFVVSDMRPISSMNGDGLTSLLSKMTCIGARYGEMSEIDLKTCGLLPSRQKVSKPSLHSMQCIVFTEVFMIKKL